MRRASDVGIQSRQAPSSIQKTDRLTSRRSVTARAPAASAADALDALVLLQLIVRHPADAGAVEIGLLGLDAAHAAELLVAGLLPLGDEVGVAVAVLQEPVVELFADGFFGVVEVVDVS